MLGAPCLVVLFCSLHMPIVLVPYGFCIFSVLNHHYNEEKECIINAIISAGDLDKLERSLFFVTIWDTGYDC